MNRLISNNGSVLLIVMIALLMVTSLYSAVILYGSYHRKLALRDVLATKAFYLAESGVEAALSHLDNEHEYSFYLTGQIKSSGKYEVNVKPFGAYLLCISKGISGSREKTIRCLLGAIPEERFNNALNLGGKDYPLTLAGRTSITGDVLVSPSGVLPGRFKGKRFGGDKLVYGEIKNSLFNRLPEYDDTIIKQFQENISDISYNNSKIIDKTYILDDESYGTIKNDSSVHFKSDLIINIADNILELNDWYYKVKGNLEIVNSSRIYGYGIIEVDGNVLIADDCYIKDIIIIANKNVLLKDQAVFAGQIIANEKVEISQHACLAGEAVVINIGKLADEDRCIYINSNKISKGTLLCDIQSTKPGRQSMFKSLDLSNTSSFSGLIFNTGYSKVSGYLEGNLSTASFYLYDAPTVYINWLVDANIISKAVYKVVPAVFSRNSDYAKVGNL